MANACGALQTLPRDADAVSIRIRGSPVADEAEAEKNARVCHWQCVGRLPLPVSAAVASAVEVTLERRMRCKRRAHRGVAIRFKVCSGVGKYRFVAGFYFRALLSAFQISCFQPRLLK